MKIPIKWKRMQENFHSYAYGGLKVTVWYASAKCFDGKQSMGNLTVDNSYKRLIIWYTRFAFSLHKTKAKAKVIYTLDKKIIRIIYTFANS